MVIKLVRTITSKTTITVSSIFLLAILLLVGFTYSTIYRSQVNHSNDGLYIRIFDHFLVLENKFWLDNRIKPKHCAVLHKFLESKSEFVGVLYICNGNNEIRDSVIQTYILKDRFPNRRTYEYKGYKVTEYFQNDPPPKLYLGLPLRVILIEKEQDFIIIDAVVNDNFWKSLLSTETSSTPDH